MLQQIIDSYQTWVTDNTFLCFSKTETSPNKYSYKTTYHYHKTAKRGNDVYNYRLRKRLSSIKSELDDNAGVNLSNRRYQHNVRCLLFTLTYRRQNFFETWYKIGKEFNCFLSALKSRYGKISHFRVWEAHKDGYPHIHCLVLFHEKGFNCFNWRGRLRIIRKGQIEPLWKHGFIDVEGVYNLKKSFEYLEKYLTKDMLEDKGLLTLALTWKTKRQTFGISKSWQIRLDKERMPNSNQTTVNMVNFDIIVEFMGVIHNDTENFWYYKTKGPPKIKKIFGGWDNRYDNPSLTVM